MTPNLFHLPEGRPDPAHWTRTNVGLSSPLWWPFLMAAGAGAAWWTYANWARLSTTSWTGDLQRTLGGAGGSQRSGELAGAALDASLAVQGEGASEVEAEVDDDGSDAIDAAYAANLGPVPPPARKPRKKAAAAKSEPKKAAAKKTAPARAVPKKAAARKTAAKKTAGKKKR